MAVVVRAFNNETMRLGVGQLGCNNRVIDTNTGQYNLMGFHLSVIGWSRMREHLHRESK
jgi:hypothetical protein